MTRKRTPALSPLYTLIAYRPNGAELAREDHVFPTAQSLQWAAGEMIARCRAERGFSPSIRCYRLDRSMTPFGPEDARDVTETYLGMGYR